MKKTIAVVDDDQPIIDAMTLILRDEGFDVVSYSCGEDLLKDRDNVYFDLVLLDYRLPEQNGAEIARKLKSRIGTKDIPVILISANHNLEATIKHAPIDDFIPKPFDISSLMKKVHNYV